MIDILLDNNDLAIVNGDLVLGRSNEQHQETLLIAAKGSFKQSPNVGVDLEGFLNDSNIDELTATVATEFAKDGMKVNSVGYDEQTGQLSYDAEYTS